MSDICVFMHLIYIRMYVQYVRLHDVFFSMGSVFHMSRWQHEKFKISIIYGHEKEMVHCSIAYITEDAYNASRFLNVEFSFCILLLFYFQ